MIRSAHISAKVFKEFVNLFQDITIKITAKFVKVFQLEKKYLPKILAIFALTNKKKRKKLLISFCRKNIIKSIFLNQNYSFSILKIYYILKNLYFYTHDYLINYVK